MEVPGSEILLPARSSSPSPVIQPARENDGPGPALCSLCLSAPGKYTCPRCNAPYCSLACYQGPRHTACSELFYRESVLQALQEEEAEPRQRRRVQEMLLHLRQEEAAAEPATGRYRVVGAEEAELWDSLTAQEKEDFNRLIQSGDIGCLVPQWKPWWETGKRDQSEGPKKILELPEAAGDPQNLTIINAADTRPPPHSNQLYITQDLSGVTAVQTENRDTEGAPKQTVVLTCGQDGSESHTSPVSKGAGFTILPQNKTIDDQNVTAIPEQSVNGPSYLKETESSIQRIGSFNMVSESKGATNIHNMETVVKEEMSTKIGPHKSSLAHQARFIKEKESTVNTDELRKDVTAKEHLSVVDQSRVSQVPPLLKSIPPLSSLSRNPSPLVQFSLVNVLYSYAFSLLQHNGDLSDNDILLNFTGTVLYVSGALTTTAVYNSTAHALKSAVRASSDPLLGGDDGGACLAIEATSNILLGDGSKRYSLAALSHLSHLLGKTRKLETEEKEIRKGAFNAKKKCLFLAAWVNENEDSLAILSAEVMTEYRQYLKDIREVAEISKELQKAWGGKRPPEKKKLIQEVHSSENEL
ncbi:zinc finger HIT domain-containing protein 2 [Mixophyes fleayi]|uniref:zinc finger HIT domain-containing protein 2 n=1 Tax=Mixophyes fleayi TaxID=3061075 RepID=UPI003F4D82E7